MRDAYKGLVFGVVSLKADGKIDRIETVRPKDYDAQQLPRVKLQLEKSAVHLAQLLNSVGFDERFTGNTDALRGEIMLVAAENRSAAPTQVVLNSNTANAAVTITAYVNPFTFWANTSTTSSTFILESTRIDVLSENLPSSPFPNA